MEGAARARRRVIEERRLRSTFGLPSTRLAQWKAPHWLARAATAIREFPDDASAPPDALCIRGRRAERVRTFDAYYPFPRLAITCRVRSNRYGWRRAKRDGITGT